MGTASPSTAYWVQPAHPLLCGRSQHNCCLVGAASSRARVEGRQTGCGMKPACSSAMSWAAADLPGLLSKATWIDSCRMSCSRHRSQQSPPPLNLTAWTQPEVLTSQPGRQAGRQAAPHDPHPSASASAALVKASTLISSSTPAGKSAGWRSA